MSIQIATIIGIITAGLLLGAGLALQPFGAGWGGPLAILLIAFVGLLLRGLIKKADPPANLCPECNFPLTEGDEGSFPTCIECGFVLYDANAKAFIAEVEREFKQAKQECAPDPVPEYWQWIKRDETRKP
jgi:hypothetical protein